MDVLLQAFVLGAIGGVVPGAVLTILLVSALQGGLVGGLRAFFWAMLSEILIAGGLLLLAAQLSMGEEVFMAIGFVGGVVLLYFAWQVFKLRSIQIHNTPALFTPGKILLLSATNAPLYIFWTTICFPLIWQLSTRWPFSVAAVSYFASFEVGWGITTFSMLLLFVFSRRTLANEGVMGKVFMSVALILAGFGINMLVRSVASLL